jgi:hypothetical protein
MASICTGGMATAFPPSAPVLMSGKLLDFGRHHRIFRLTLASLTSLINRRSRYWSSIAGRGVHGETSPRRTIEILA